MKNIHAVIIDPQVDFCDPKGALPVLGAWEDMAVRLPKMIDRLGKKINDYHVTLDSHPQLHIAHPIWYLDNKGKHPEPFTLLREEKGQIIGSRMDSAGKFHDVGEYRAFSPNAQTRTIKYLKDLSAAGRYPHCIWPIHCLIGTPGHNVVAPLMESLLNWARLQGNSNIDFVTKGSNPWAEHFSAVQAEVPDPEDPTTQLNVGFIKILEEADEVLFCGEAGSHCLANTVRDIANSFKDSNDTFLKKCVLITDATSPVPGFESFQDDFIKEMKNRGMKTTTTTDYLA